MYSMEHVTSKYKSAGNDDQLMTAIHCEIYKKVL
jgi:hypothetical protein